MTGSVARRVTEISVKSHTSFEDAIRTGVERASQTLRGISAAWVKEQNVDAAGSSPTRSICWSPSCSISHRRDRQPLRDLRIPLSG